jgi:Na+/H+-dicarboxylate symporter
VPVAGIALLLGADRFMAQIRAATNLTSNIIATLVVGRWVGSIDVAAADAELKAGFAEDPDGAGEGAGRTV